MIKLIYENIIKLLHQEIKTGKYAHYTFEQKFWIQVNKKSIDECWNFIGKKFTNGYGCFRIGTLDTLAHRISFLLNNHYLPSNQRVIMHICDNKTCVNPHHLLDGSYSDNLQDMIKKNRGNPPSGERNHRCKLTNIQIDEIRQKNKEKISRKQLSIDYNVSITQIGRIINYTRRANNNAN